MKKPIFETAIKGLVVFLMLISLVPTGIKANDSVKVTPGLTTITKGTIIRFATYDWVALGAPNADNKVTVLAANNGVNAQFGIAAFNDVTKPGNTDYAHSTIKAQVDAITDRVNFLPIEKTKMSNLRLLTAEDVTAINDVSITAFPTPYWIDTPSSEDPSNLQAYVKADGKTNLNGDWAYYKKAIRPVFDLDLNGVVLTSSGEEDGGKELPHQNLGKFYDMNLSGGRIKLTYGSDNIKFRQPRMKARKRHRHYILLTPR